MGNHIHNDLPTYRRVVEVIQSGALGKIHRVDCSLVTGADSIGSQPDSAPPPELDYEFWLGPAPRRPYNPLRSHYNYRYFWDYSGGKLIDFWCHYTDVACWALDLKAPTQHLGQRRPLERRRRCRRNSRHDGSGLRLSRADSHLDAPPQRAPRATTPWAAA